MTFNFQVAKAAADEILEAIALSNPDPQAVGNAFMGAAPGAGVPPSRRRAAVIGALREAEHKMCKFRERLLLDLANVTRPDAVRLLKLMEPLEPKTPRAINAAQEFLRLIWPRDVTLDMKQWLANHLLVAALKSEGVPFPRIVAPLAAGSLQFTAANFPGQVLIGILENWPRMARCGNPECPAPYFYAGRTSQCYCERGQCTKYALRTKALKWWRENRAKRLGKAKISEET